MPSSVRSKTRNLLRQRQARLIIPRTVFARRKCFREHSPIGVTTSDNEISDPGLTRKCRGVHADNDRSVSEGVQCSIEVSHSWCRNILADHPPWAQSSDQGKEVSGQVGVASRPSTRSVSVFRAWIASADEIDSPRFRRARREGSHVSPPPHVGPVLFENSGCMIVQLYLPNCFESARPLEPQFDTTDSGKETTDCNHASLTHCCPASSPLLRVLRASVVNSPSSATRKTRPPYRNTLEPS